MAPRKRATAAAKPGKGKSADDYWITRPAQLEALTSSKRQVVLDIVSAHGPMTAKDLAEILSMSRTTLYQHLQKLLSAGLLLEAGSREGTKKPEKLYATPARRMRITKAIAKRRNRDVIDKILCSTMRQTVRDLQTGLDHPDLSPEGDQPNYRFGRLSFNVSDDKLRRLNKKLAEIIKILDSQEKDEGPLMSFSFAVSRFAGRSGDN